MTAFHLTVNETPVEVDVPGMRRLLDVLREELGLTGTKEGCGEGECGACTVLLDGAPVDSCLVPICQVEGSSVATVEGLAPATNTLDTLQTAFLEAGGAQCGICTPGMILAAVALGPRPSQSAIRTGLAGNICRCTGYSAIYRSIQRAGAYARVRR
jgi:aerobic-type carbon monoxide dehydrogenase small subunit (CoxS/CutS family)